MGDRKTAEQFYNNGVTAANDKSAPEYLQHAFQMFVSACYADPTFATAWYQAGNNDSDMMHFPAAIACWRRALECEMPVTGSQSSTDAARAKVLCNIGWRLESLGQTYEALEATQESVRLDDKLPFSWLNLSIIQTRLGRLEEAVKSARTAHELMPNDATVEMGLAFALLFNRNLAEGFKAFESRYRYKLKNFTKYPYPVWTGEPGKTIFLVSDQGLGDTLSMCRFLELTCKRAAYVHACVHPELVRLLEYWRVEQRIDNLNIIPQPSNFPAADAWTTFVSLPYALGLSDDEIRNTEQIKYEAPVIDPKRWRVPDRKIHIGITWRGSALNETNEWRSIPLENFLTLYKVPGVQLYGLQCDANKQQLHDQGCAPVIKDLSLYIRDVADSCSILRGLDFVVGCDSALGHICTLARKEYWLGYAWMAKDYRVGFRGEDQIWSKYKVFMQGPERRWEPVFDQMVEALRERTK